MTQYTIIWETEAIEAENPFEAAQEALNHIRDGYARCFITLNEQTGEMHSVDLMEDERHAVFQLHADDYVSAFKRNKK